MRAPAPRGERRGRPAGAAGVRESPRGAEARAHEALAASRGASGGYWGRAPRPALGVRVSDAEEVIKSSRVTSCS